MKRIYLITAIALSSGLLTCHHNVTESEIPKPGKRNYTWAIDTISYSGSLQTLLTTLWASSPNDVWIGGFNERGWGELYHYDGNHWQVVIHGYTKIDIGQIYGFTPNDVYLAGEYPYVNPAPPPNFLDSSAILHYDGTRWTEVQLERGRGLQCIWGTSKASIFAAGLFGTLFHYDGKQWTRIQVDTSIWFSKIGGTADETYLLGYITPDYTPDGIEREYLLKWQGTTFVLVDSMALVPGYIPLFPNGRIIAIEKNIYGVGNGIFKKKGSGWERIISGGESFGGLYGTRNEHIFACGTTKTLYHFNGIDWKKLDIPGNPALPLSDVWCTENEVFILGDDGFRSYVIHGK